MYIHSSRSYAPSPMEVATLIANAKQASANVLIAQQQVQAAKENVLHQQRIAAEKEAHSSILTQKSETVAAIQRSEAAAAAQSVILAQQRLAAAKNSVAQQQRLASAQEAKAATALHNSAHAAAAEIRRTGTKYVFCWLHAQCFFSKKIKINLLNSLYRTTRCTFSSYTTYWFSCSCSSFNRNKRFNNWSNKCW